MEKNLIFSRSDNALYNLNHVYKIEKNRTDVKFYLINGESFTMNSGYIPEELKEFIDNNLY